ncbi:MAG: hypothetical protein QOI63_130, partial [Thermoplasmata archaeon]|nr:hypothetical protein [Thermoplasmata archaeon]
MQRILASAGLIAVLIASGLGAEAYHITGAASYEGYSTYGWAARGTVFPLAQDLSTQACLAVADHSLPMHPVRPSMCALSGASRSLDPNGVVCEQYDVSDLAIPGYALTGVSLPGIGGLCFMSAGTSNWSSCATPGFFNGGRSDGYYPAYAGAGTCAPFPPPVTPSNRHGFLPAPASGSSNLIRITMCPSSSHTLGSPGPLAGGGPVPTCVGPDTTFHARINGVDCVQPPG